MKNKQLLKGKNDLVIKLIRDAMEQQEITDRMLAIKTGTIRQNIYRKLSGKYFLSLDFIFQVETALNIKIINI